MFIPFLVTYLELSSHCGGFAHHLSDISCQSDCVGVHCDVLYVEFLLTEVSVGVTPFCLFNHVGYCCLCLPSFSVYSKQASVQAAAQVRIYRFQYT